jgi:hypothetical protein
MQRAKGDVTMVQYELEPNGKASYEFDIRPRQGQGPTMQVEVDVTSGEVVEAHPQLYAIGGRGDEQMVGQRE